MKLTHINDKGYPEMVDIGGKKSTERASLSYGKIKLSSETISLIYKNKIKKGNVISTAIIGGIFGAKNTSKIIPLTHPIPIDNIKIFIEKGYKALHVFSLVKTDFKTGIEMESLFSVSSTLLTIYDMVKAVEKSAEIEKVKLLFKSGGKSGTFISEELKGEVKNSFIAIEKPVPFCNKFFHFNKKLPYPEGFLFISPSCKARIVKKKNTKILDIIEGRISPGDRFLILPFVPKGYEKFSHFLR